MPTLLSRREAVSAALAPLLCGPLAQLAFAGQAKKTLVRKDISDLKPGDPVVKAYIAVYWFSENRKNAFTRLATVRGLRRSLITL